MPARQETNAGSIAARLLAALKARGARAVFGIPGDYALPLFETIETSGILPLYTLSHEPAVAFAADAAARAAGGIGVAAATYGAGALNLVNGVAGAYAERSPMAVISAAPARQTTGLLPHHLVRTADSQLRIFREITCAQAVLDDPKTAPAEIARVLGECRRLSLPVYFEIPSDCAHKPCDAVPPPDAPVAHAAAARECAQEIARLFAGARNPVIMIGVEVRRHGIEADVAELARRTHIPVVTSFMGRGVASSQDLDIAGSYLGLAGDPAVTGLVEDSDALVLLGVILSDTNLGVAAQRLDLRRVVHAFGGEVRIGHHVYPDLPLKSLIAALAHAMPAHEHRHVLPAPPQPHVFVEDDERVRPADVASALNAAFAGTHFPPVVCDVGDSLFISLALDRSDLAAQGYYASMGFAVPAAFGIQAVTGERPVVLVGDGAFQMTGWELGNCRRYGLDPVVIVLNNRSWGMLELFSPRSGFTALSDWRFADMAAPLGGHGIRVRTRKGLAEALKAAWAARGAFQLVEVALEPGETSDTLHRFAAAIAKNKAPA